MANETKTTANAVEDRGSGERAGKGGGAPADSSIGGSSGVKREANSNPQRAGGGSGGPTDSSPGTPQGIL